MFKIEINTDNAAFGDNWYGQSIELLRVLKGVESFIRQGAYLDGEPHAIKDINGNTVGFWSLDDKAGEEDAD